MIVHSGMGDVNTVVTQTGGSVGGGLLTAGAIAGGPTNPVGLGLMIGGAATALGSALLGVFGVGKRNPYEDKDVKTLNDLESALQANLAGWQAGSKTASEQQQRLAAFDYYFGQLQNLCADPNLPSDWASGCIKDRSPGGKYDWYAMYRTPIANSTPSDSGTVSGALDTVVGSSGTMFIGIGLVLLGVVLVTKD